MSKLTLQQKIHAVLAAQRVPLTTTQIAKEMGELTSKMHPTMHALVKRGAIEIAGKTRFQGRQQNTFRAVVNYSFHTDKDPRASLTYEEEVELHEKTVSKAVDRLRKNSGPFGLMAAQLS